MTEKEIDLFADSEKTSADVTEQINEKKYQIVDLKNGTYQFKRYNGASAEQRYTSLGYFKLGEKLVKDCFKEDEVKKRKVEGNKTIRRARSDAFTKLRNVLPFFRSEYQFFHSTNKISEAELILANKYADELNEKLKSEKIIAGFEAVIAIGRELSHLTMNQALTPEQRELYKEANTYMTNISFNVQDLLKKFSV